MMSGTLLYHSIIYHLLLLKQVSLTLKLDWQSASPRNPHFIFPMLSVLQVCIQVAIPYFLGGC